MACHLVNHIHWAWKDKTRCKMHNNNVLSYSLQDVPIKLKKFVRKLRKQSTRQYKTRWTHFKRTVRKLLTWWIKSWQLIREYREYDCVVPENIHTSPTDGFLFEPPPPLWKFQFSYILSYKKFWPLNPTPSEFARTDHGVGMDIGSSGLEVFCTPYLCHLNRVFDIKWLELFDICQSTFLSLSCQLINWSEKFLRGGVVMFHVHSHFSTPGLCTFWCKEKWWWWLLSQFMDLISQLKLEQTKTFCKWQWYRV